MLGGVVEQVEENLLEPLGIARNERYLRGRRGVIDLHTGLLYQLAVSKERVLEFGCDVDKLDTQIEAPVLYPCEFEKLRHHAGQPLGFFGYDVYAAQRIPLNGGVICDSLGPAGYGGQRCPQLVRDLRDEFRPRFFRHSDLLGHVVDLGGEAAELVYEFILHLYPVAALCDALGKACELCYRV